MTESFTVPRGIASSRPRFTSVPPQPVVIEADFPYSTVTEPPPAQVTTTSSAPVSVAAPTVACQGPIWSSRRTRARPPGSPSAAGADAEWAGAEPADGDGAVVGAAIGAGSPVHALTDKSPRTTMAKAR
ncbi:hypothetical protein ACFY36_36495 [Actinoplanes sp. NPDC000266]